MPTKQPTGARGAEHASADEGLVGDAIAGLEWEAETSAKAGGLADSLRKAMVAGLGAVFMTEEGIRTLVKDLKLPKELMGFVIGQAERSKSELLRMVQNELRRFLESELLREELKRVLSETVVEVKAEIRMRPDGREPDVKVTSSATRRGKKG